MRFFYLPFIVLASSAAHAQGTFIPPTLAQSDRIKVNGWDQYLKLGVTGNISDNKKVVGKSDGQASTLGGKIEGAIDFKEQSREWLNSLDLILSYNRTPQLGRYIKSDDNLALESLYKYYFADFSGAFTRLNVESSLAEGFDDREADVTYLIRKTNGETQTLTTDRLALTQGLRPFKVRESLGVFTNLYDQPLFRFDIKAGLGLRQVIANKQRVLADDKETAQIEVDQLRNTQKAGYEIGSDIGGGTEDKRFTYKVGVNALFPFYEDPEESKTGSSAYEKRVLDINGKLSFHLVEWASIDYVYKMVRDPSITADAQVSQSYLFSMNYILAARRG